MGFVRARAVCASRRPSNDRHRARAHESRYPRMRRIYPRSRTRCGGLLPLLLLAACLMLAGRATGAERPGAVPASTVVVVKNLTSPDSVAIADYYASKRKLP